MIKTDPNILAGAIGGVGALLKGMNVDVTQSKTDTLETKVEVNKR